MTTIDETEMPVPDTIVNCKNGGPIAAMFFYAAAEQSFVDIATEHGFKCMTATLEHDDDDLWQEYSDGGDVLNAWNPEIPDGWTFGAKIDTEDGPIAIFIQPGTSRLPQEIGEVHD